ncbi:unnamed protein product, partial [Heterosigma akashiwo]
GPGPRGTVGAWSQGEVAADHRPDGDQHAGRRGADRAGHRPEPAAAEPGHQGGLRSAR